MLDINVEKLDRIIDDFYKITGVMIGAYDRDFKPISNKTYPHCSLCKKVRSYDELAAKCYKCDIEGIKKCIDSRETQTYECHMGLTEAVTPIYAGGIIIGYILIGQMLNEKSVDNVKQKIADLDYEINKTSFYNAMSKVPLISEDKIEAVISLMIICTKHLMVENIVNVKSSLLSKQIQEYINANLSQDIGINDICKRMNISRTKLYEVSSAFFKMGITDYIRYLRVEKAKELLTERKYNVKQITKLVGFDDANYFTKIFKRYTGMTPSEYKNIGRKEMVR